MVDYEGLYDEVEDMGQLSFVKNILEIVLPRESVIFQEL